MRCRSSELLCILLFAFGIFFLNPLARAQACTPTVYLFRHAEDGSGGLTGPGKEHAKLYPNMLTHYQSIYPDCPIRRVLATYDGMYPGPNPRQGTKNPLETAKPLAKQCCGGEDHVEMILKDSFSNEYPLYELISDSPNGGLAPPEGGLYGRIFYVLQGTLDHQGSVGIFWTQQGMPDVSRALGVPPVDIPGPNNAAYSWPGRLRSSVNQFIWTGNSYVAQYTFTVQNPPTKRTDIKPAQCFKTSLISTKYHCSNSGILNFVPYQGKFCVNFSPEGGDNYAYCL